MDSAYYRSYRKLELEHWWFRGRETILRKLVAETVADSGEAEPGRTRILNVGAATGRTSEWLGEFGEVVSVEYNRDCARMAEEFTGLEMTVASAEDLPYPDNSFDLVTAFDVIEHIEDHQRAVDEMARVVREGGAIFVTVPAFPFLWSEHDDINHHYRRYRPKELPSLFGEMSTRRQGYFNFLLFPPIALVRVVSTFLRRWRSRDMGGPQSDFEISQPGVISRCLENVLIMEGRLIAKGWRFPFGVSEFLVARKEAEARETAVPK